MTVRVECHGCGRKFQAPKRLAGQQVKCPGCAAPIQVGSEATAAIGDGPPILLQCTCQRQFEVAPASAGGREKCPECGREVPVPGAEPAGPAKPAGRLDLDRLLGAEMTDPAPPSTPQVPPKKTPDEDTA
jgi:hypothetical protein